MTPLIIAAALSLVALDSTPAASQSGAPATTVAPATVKGAKQADSDTDPDKVICRNQPITGSRFEKRICMTRGDWAEQQRRTEDFERRLGETRSAHSGGGMSGQ